MKVEKAIKPNTFIKTITNLEPMKNLITFETKPGEPVIVSAENSKDVYEITGSYNLQKEIAPSTQENPESIVTMNEEIIIKTLRKYIDDQELIVSVHMDKLPESQKEYIRNCMRDHAHRYGEIN